MNDQLVNATLVAGLENYLIRRRALGFGLVEEERHARRFLEWLWAHGSTGAAFTTAQALSWARGEGQFKNSYQALNVSQRSGEWPAIATPSAWTSEFLPPMRCAPVGTGNGPTSTPRTSSMR